jgi:aspartate racemase
MSSRKIVGIVGGVGPYAGLDLSKKVFDHTLATTDQEHLDLVMLSWPQSVADRTAFLLGRSDEDPAPALCECLLALESIGCSVAGIACNTAHSPRLFQALKGGLRARGSSIELLNMIEEVAAFLRRYHPSVRRVGVLATDGTVAANVYGEILCGAGFEAVYSEPAVQRDMVQAAIYDRGYGLKAFSDPVTDRARSDVLQAARHLVEVKQAEAIVLGCTELPLAVREPQLFGRPVIDASMVLARALVARVAPEKLRPHVA